MTDTRDELAKVLHNSPNGKYLTLPGPVPIAHSFADAILASDWLANLRADVWDEGHDEGRFNSHGSSLYCKGNPYRKTVSPDVSR